MLRMRSLVCVATLALLGAACGSSGETQDQPSTTATSGGGVPASGATASEVPVPDPIQGCVPSCNTPGITMPGPLSLGPYETQWFFGGEMAITLAEPWSSHEDSTGELLTARLRDLTARRTFAELLIGSLGGPDAPGSARRDAAGGGPLRSARTWSPELPPGSLVTRLRDVVGLMVWVGGLRRPPECVHAGRASSWGNRGSTHQLTHGCRLVRRDHLAHRELAPARGVRENGISPISRRC
jgi:hypothetical protein